MRTISSAVLVIVLFFGCSADEPTIPTELEAKAVNHFDSPNATGGGVDLFLACLDAMGGEDGFTAMESGYVRFTTTMPLMAKMHPDPPATFDPTVIMSIYYDSMGRERRRVRSRDGKFDTLFITDGREVWMRNQDGNESVIPKNPNALPSKGPIIVGVMQTFPALLSRSLRMELGSQDEGCPTCDVIDISDENGWIGRLFLDHESHLPQRLEQVIGETPFGDDISNRLTITDYSEFRSFGLVVLPTRMTATQDGESLFDITLKDADFLTEVDDQLLELPSSE